VSNFRIFAVGWSMSGAMQFALRIAGIYPGSDLRDIMAGLAMAAAWGLAAVAIFGDRKRA
jgi:hypothetical protein